MTQHFNSVLVHFIAIQIKNFINRIIFEIVFNMFITFIKILYDCFQYQNVGFGNKFLDKVFEPLPPIKGYIWTINNFYTPSTLKKFNQIFESCFPTLCSNFRRFLIIRIKKIYVEIVVFYFNTIIYRVKYFRFFIYPI